MKRIMEKFFGNIISGIFALYFIVAIGFFTPYFNWQYAKENGFIKWILLGELSATAKAFLWPFNLKPSAVSSLKHFSNAMGYKNQATNIENASEPYITIPDDEFSKVMDLMKLALKEAKKVNVNKLNHIYADYGTNFSKYFIPGIESYIEGFEKNNTLVAIAGQDRLNKWSDWYNDNIDAIRSAIQK